MGLDQPVDGLPASANHLKPQGGIVWVGEWVIRCRKEVRKVCPINRCGGLNVTTMNNNDHCYY